jgi:hypothetical protein
MKIAHRAFSRYPELLEDRIAPAALVALDSNNSLLSFDSATPGTVTAVAVSGLGAGESLIGIDFRPATGALYGLTLDGASAGRLYVLNAETGAATFSAMLTADPTDSTDPFASLSGSNFGVDFNPVPDRLRVVSDTGLNLRINVDNGFVTTDAPINPGSPALSGAAYANSFAGATGTTLYDIDSASDSLLIQNPPNNGTTVSVGALGVDVTGVAGFDIVSTRSASGAVTNQGFAALTAGGTTALYTVDLVSGAATSLGGIAAGAAGIRGLAASLGAPTANAFTISDTGELFRFNVATPGVTTSVGLVSGLGGGEAIVGMDFRPANGAMYLVTRDAAAVGRLYTVNTTTAVATPVATLAADPADSTNPYTNLAGANYGVDFNPVPDRLRVVSGSGQNLRINVDNGLVTTDGDLNGAATGAVDAAYTNSFPGATGTTLFDIDAGSDRLLTQNPPNSGTLVVVGDLGVNAAAVGGFDIRANGEAFAALTVGGVDGLYSIDLNTGAATLVGSIGGVVSSTGFALVPNGTLQFTTNAVSVTEDGGNAQLTINRIGGSDGTVSVLVDTNSGTATVGSDFTSISRVVTFGPGVTSQNISIPILDSGTMEDRESFTVTLSGPSGGASLNALSTATVSILDTNGITLFETNGTNLNLINAAVPGTIVKSTPISGLEAGETIVGLDLRPATGELYGLGSTSRLYTIDPVTTVATQVGSGTFAVPLNGSSFGFDFNPTVDRIRVVSNTGQNIRLNPATGQMVDADPNVAGVQPDGNLAYAAGDPNAGQTPNITGIAYTNNVAGAATTTLFGIDSSLDILVTQNPPNNGTLNTIGSLGVNATSVIGFDVRPGGDTALATLVVGGTAGLYDINLTTGQATFLGDSVPNRTSLAIGFDTTISIADVVQVEGNSGTKPFNFVVSLSAVNANDVEIAWETLSGDASADDFAPASGTLLIPAGQLTGTISINVIGDTAVEPNELFSVALNSTNIGTIADNAADGIILNDDAEFTGNKASFLDAQGNRVTIITSKGTLAPANLILSPSGFGVQLAELDLTSGGFEGANIAVTAKPTLAGGDGFANVGYIDATGVSLGKVTLSGDLGQIDAGGVKSLTAQSLGRLGLSTQGAAARWRAT